jgi:hypothetical protein
MASTQTTDLFMTQMLKEHVDHAVEKQLRPLVEMERTLVEQVRQLSEQIRALNEKYEQAQRAAPAEKRVGGAKSKPPQFANKNNWFKSNGDRYVDDAVKKSDLWLQLEAEAPIGKEKPNGGGSTKARNSPDWLREMYFRYFRHLTTKEPASPVLAKIMADFEKEKAAFYKARDSHTEETLTTASSSSQKEVVDAGKAALMALATDNDL